MKDLCIAQGPNFLTDERDLIIQQIDMLFDTLPNEVLGENYGTNFYQFLWDMNCSNQEISEYTKQVIKNNVNLFGWSCDVETTILEGTKNDILLITVKLSTDFDSFEKTYKVD